LGTFGRSGDTAQIPGEPGESGGVARFRVWRRYGNELQPEITGSKCGDKRLHVGTYPRRRIAHRRHIEPDFDRIYHLDGPFRLLPLYRCANRRVNEYDPPPEPRRVCPQYSSPSVSGAGSIAPGATAPASGNEPAIERRPYSNGGPVWRDSHRRASIPEVTCK
jgi:hypothetical protein